MGSSPSSNKDDLQNFKNNIKNEIEKSFSSWNFRQYNDIINWKTYIIEFIEILIDSKFKMYQKKVQIESFKVPHTINQNKIKEASSMGMEKLNVFTSEEIQKKNKQITTEFEKISYNYDNDDDEIENSTLAEFLQEVANISRIAFNDSNEYIKQSYIKFENEQKEVQIISSLDQFKINFACWAKKNNIFEILFNHHYKEKNMSFIDKQTEQKKKNYFIKLYHDLLTLYFQCALCFPPVEINFNQKNYDSTKMIDYFNKGSKDKKVNFVIFPSLYSNGKFLENGKQWVFTYFDTAKKKTFYFKEPKLIHLIKNDQIFNIPNLKDKLKLNLKKQIVITPDLNYQISKEIKQKYIYTLKNKNTQEIEEKNSEGSTISFRINYEFIKCDFYIQDQLILSINEIS